MKGCSAPAQPSTGGARREAGIHDNVNTTRLRQLKTSRLLFFFRELLVFGMLGRETDAVGCLLCPLFLLLNGHQIILGQPAPN